MRLPMALLIITHNYAVEYIRIFRSTQSAVADNFNYSILVSYRKPSRGYHHRRCRWGVHPRSMDSTLGIGYRPCACHRRTHRHPPIPPIRTSKKRHADSSGDSDTHLHRHSRNHMDAVGRGAHTHRLRSSLPLARTVFVHHLPGMLGHIGDDRKLMDHHSHHRSGIHRHRAYSRLQRSLDCRSHHLRSIFR